MMKRIHSVLQNRGHEMMDLPNVVGVGIGRKEVDGAPLDEPAITALVRRKVDAALLTEDERVPSRVEDVATDVVQVGQLRLLTDPVRTGRMRPASPGVSIGHHRVSAGTFGGVMYDADTGDPLILSNNHVLANITNGSDERAALGDPVLQPGAYDGGLQDRDAIGVLERFVPLEPLEQGASCGLAATLERAGNRLLDLLRLQYHLRVSRRRQVTNRVDAALAAPLDSAAVATKIVGIGTVTHAAPPTLDMEVRKSGRTSGVTEGRIRVVNATVNIALGDVGTGLFSEQIVTTPMAQPGDSGSLLVDADRRAVGLLSAGSARSSVAGTIANVMDLLNVRLRPD